MESNKKNISEKLLSEISSFESFFEAVGFKRLYGAIYGLLTLSKEPLTSEEIEENLKISQSAVSQAVKILVHFNIIQMKGRNDNRQHLYGVKENSLSVVASIISKREQAHIADLKRMSERVLSILELDEKALENDIRVRRVESIKATSSIAASFCDFIIKLGDERFGNAYLQIENKLPILLNTLLQGKKSFNTITSNLSGKLKATFLKNIGEMNE